MKTFRFLLLAGIVLTGCLFSSTAAAQNVDVIDTAEVTDVSIIKGDLVTLKVHSLTRLSISDPSIADVVSADANELLLIGNSLGASMFFIWDEHGKRTIFIRVVKDDLHMIKKRLEKLMEDAGIEEDDLEITINNFEGKVIVTGTAVQDNIKRIKGLAGRFGGNVLFMAQEKTEDLIQIDMQISELNSTLLKGLGFKWTTGSNSSVSLVYSESIPTTFDDQFDRLVKTGQWSRTTALLATIDAFITEGRARVLSKPTLLVSDGKEASFQVGGQIPIRTTSTSTSGTSQENVTFKDFGVLVSVRPQRVDNGKIGITLTVEDSDVDASLPTESDVGFTTRSASTQLILEDQQTIVLAGLIKTNRSESLQKVPFLGDLPIIGAAFRHRSNTAADKDTELVISLKPTILYDGLYDRDEMALAKKKKLEEASRTGEEDLMSDESDEVEDAPEDEDGWMDSEDENAFEEAADNEDVPELVMSETMESDGPDIDEEKFDEKVDIDEIVRKISAQDDGDDVAAASGEWDPSLPDFSGTQNLRDAGISDDLAGYVQIVQGKISQAISYPFEAVEKGWHGTVKITLKILKDGTLDEASIKESSGHEIFDRDALNTAQILAPFSAFPPDLEMDEIIVTVPIVYSQDSAALELAACHLDITADAQEKYDPELSGRSYEELVQHSIANLALYPEGAKRYGWEGTVKLNLKILKDGTLERATVKESSGYKLFDECALQTAKFVAPYSVFPSGSDLQALNVTIPIVYSLERN